MIPVLILAYFLGGLWSAERFRETPGGISRGEYLMAVLAWPAVWFMAVIEADIPENKTGDDDDKIE